MWVLWKRHGHTDYSQDEGLERMRMKPKGTRTCYPRRWSWTTQLVLSSLHSYIKQNYFFDSKKPIYIDFWVPNTEQDHRTKSRCAMVVMEENGEHRGSFRYHLCFSWLESDIRLHRWWSSLVHISYIAISLLKQSKPKAEMRWYFIRNYPEEWRL